MDISVYQKSHANNTVSFVLMLIYSHSLCSKVISSNMGGIIVDNAVFCLLISRLTVSLSSAPNF